MGHHAIKIFSGRYPEAHRRPALSGQKLEDRKLPQGTAALTAHTPSGKSSIRATLTEARRGASQRLRRSRVRLLEQGQILLRG